MATKVSVSSSVLSASPKTDTGTLKTAKSIENFVDTSQPTDPKTAKKPSDSVEKSSNPVEKFFSAIKAFCSVNAKIVKIVICVLLLAGYLVYLGFAFAHDFEKSKILLILTGIVVAGTIYCTICRRYLNPKIKVCCKPVQNWVEKVWEYCAVRWGVVIAIMLFYVGFLLYDTWSNPYRLVSLAGIFIYVVFCFLFSTNPSKIKWRPVIWGIVLQFALGYFLLRLDFGFQMFDWLSNKIVMFLEYAQIGTEFVYGFLVKPPNICDMRPIFAFTVLQTIIFFAAIIAVLYYWGVIQAILIEMAWLVQATMGTTATESLNAVGCIFLGMTEAPIMIRPYLSKMTKSELNAVFTAGFACIAGSLFVAYVSFGVK